MPKIKIKGVKSYRSKRKTYHYHRATNIRIDIDLEAEPQRFLLRVQELDNQAKALPTAVTISPRVETLGGLFDAWKMSEEAKSLKPQTWASYERVIDPEVGALRKVRARALREFNPAFVVALRDAVAKKQKRWMGNYAVKVLRTAFAWGRLHGWCVTNPAEKIPMLSRPAGKPEANRPWSSEEFDIVWNHASSRMRRALALAHYAGLRVGDVVLVPWSAWDGETLTVRQSKTGQVVHVLAPGPLKVELNSAKREGTQIVVNSWGQPYTRDGLQTNLWKLVKALEVKSLVKPGLCFHGLRHSLGAALFDLGLDRDARKAALGHRSDAASIVYERGGNRRAASDRAFAALDVHLAAANKPKNAK
jgi:integrase